MITFYPGPSKVYPQVEQYLQDAFQSGILSANHRSELFMQMLENTIGNFKTKLEIPADYEVYFVSSATECWEIISQSLVENGGFHIYNGAFGAKWLEYAKKIKLKSRGEIFGINEVPNADILKNCSLEDVICLTHNETSNGTALPASFIKDLRGSTEKLIAVDATSSMAGAVLPWAYADVWYASVQKCFGLPSGLGVMVVSPKAIDRALRLAENNHYNSLLFIRENFLKFQTPYTPNSLGIYLLGRVLEQIEPVSATAAVLEARAADFYQFLDLHGYEPLIEKKEVRSHTVIAVSANLTEVAKIKKLAKENGIILGNGYGAWKETTLRIANFPAITDDEFSKLKHILANAAL